MNSCKKIYLFLLALAIILTLSFIWGNSLLDSKASTELSTGFLGAIEKPLAVLGLSFKDDILLRKFMHFFEFYLLGAEFILFVFCLGKFMLKSAAACAAICFFVAVVDETIQFFSGRYSSFLDVILDFSGGLLGIICLSCILHFYFKRKI